MNPLAASQTPADFRFATPSAASSAAPSAATTLAEVERLHIERVLEQEGGHVARAARRLGISTSSLYERLKRFAVPAGRG